MNNSRGLEERAMSYPLCTNSFFICSVFTTSFPGPFPWLGGSQGKGPGNEVVVFKQWFSVEYQKVVVICITTPRDWLKKNLAPLSHPIRGKSKTNRDTLTQVFPHFASVKCNYFEFRLVHWTDCILSSN